MCPALAASNSIGRGVRLSAIGPLAAFPIPAIMGETCPLRRCPALSYVQIPIPSGPNHGEYSPRTHRLRHPHRLHAVRAGDRCRPETLHEDEHRLLPVGPLDSGVDRRVGVCLGEPGGTRGDRDGRVRRQVRHDDLPFLLAGGRGGDGLRGRIHDAVLLRIESPLRARIPEAPFRRKDPRTERDFVRGDDGLPVGHVDVRRWRR